jgi:hypothetical protein
MTNDIHHFKYYYNLPASFALNPCHTTSKSAFWKTKNSLRILALTITVISCPPLLGHPPKTMNMKPPTLNFELETLNSGRYPSSAAPNSSSALPKSSSRTQLEPFAGKPNLATRSRPTPYNFDPKKSPSHLSPLPPGACRLLIQAPRVIESVASTALVGRGSYFGNSTVRVISVVV